MNNEQVLSAATEEWIDGFKAGWQSSGEGYNGEYPDEGQPWESSAGREAMLRVLESRVRDNPFRESSGR